jgi:hypothetical protein
MKYESEFIAWLHTRYFIPNGDVLISFMEDGESYDIFLDEMGLTDD